MQTQTREILGQLASIIRRLESIVTPNGATDNGCGPSPLQTSDSHASQTPNVPTSSRVPSTLHRGNEPAQNIPFVARVQTVRTLRFGISDVFRPDAALAMRNRYPLWRFRGFWFQAPLGLPTRYDPPFQRFTKASRYVNVLEGREDVGSMLLQVAMLLQYQCYRSLQEHCPRNSILTSALKQIFAEDWDRMDASTRATHRSKLHRQLERGRRWSIVTKRLSFGVLILGGKKLSTQV